MKITVFSAKGSAGKTPISVNIALERDFAIGTNETYHVLDRLFPDERLISVAPSEEFPEFPADIDIVFDLGGALGGDSAPSIRSAVIQSDVVLVPVYNEYKCINAAFHTVEEVRALNPNIVLVVTKIEKRKREMFSDWRQSADFREVTGTLSQLLEHEYPAVPLKFSKGFDIIFDREASLRELVEEGGIDAYNYRLVADQFDELYTAIERVGE